MKFTKLMPSLFSIALLFNACGSNDIHSNQDDKGSFTNEEKKFIHNLFLTDYLWYDQVSSNIDYTTINTPNQLVEELRVTPPDRWSFSMSKKEYDNFTSQKTEGFGFGYTQDFDVYLVRIGSPAYGKLFRGDKIVGINNQLATTATLEEAKSKLGTATTFVVLRDGQEMAIEIIPKGYKYKVTEGKIIHANNKKIGYLRYDSFSASSVGEFEQEFTHFKQENIDDLVIDLRYNGGGSITVASALLDNISNAQPGARQGYLDWNANYKDRNENFYFSDEVEANDLNMKRVIFLVTKNSASASEVVISALKPYLGSSNVITIGTATHGKNVGMAGRVYGDNYYFLINFFIKNNNNETTSFSGIPATCLANDDTAHKMGDKNEAMLSTALYYIANNRCP